MRKLASVQRIKEITPITGADAIERARILGWDLVVKKDEFKPGDMAVYIEIDSVVPERPEFEFLRAKKFKIKTIRLRGQVSQGIAFRVQDVLSSKYWNLPEGSDVTELLGIKHCDELKPNKPKGLARIFKTQRAGLPFPGYVPKTDETRVQILQDLLDKYRGQEFYVTEKMDGSSHTTSYYNGDLAVCSRNWRLAEPGTTWWAKTCNRLQLAKKLKWVEYHFAAALNKYAFDFVRATRKKVFAPMLDLVNIDGGVDNNYWDLAYELDLPNKLRQLKRNLAIQGEMCGPGIQGNKYALQKKHLFVFSVLDIDTQKFLPWDELTALCKQLGLETVPIVFRKFTLDHTSDELLKLADGKSQVYQKVLREGIVLRPEVPAYDNTIAGLNHSIVSFKAVSNKWLEAFDKA